MRRHPDELVGRYRLGDTGSIRRYFEANPTEFENALDVYRAWKGAEDESAWDAMRYDLVLMCRRVGANWPDWQCVLRCAMRRRDLGLPCPPWFADENAT